MSAKRLKVLFGSLKVVWSLVTSPNHPKFELNSDLLKKPKQHGHGWKKDTISSRLMCSRIRRTRVIRARAIDVYSTECK